MHQHPIVPFCLAALAAAPALTAQVQLTELVTIDVSSTATMGNPQFIGSNPSAVAWDGTDLFLAGNNNSPTAGTVALVKVSAALGPTPVFGAAFGQQAAPSFRGFIGLDIGPNLLVASFDDGGSSPAGISAWDAAGNNLWFKSGRGSSGVGLDPGFNGVDVGTGWTTFGSGRRSLQDNATGADLYTSANGMIINPLTSTFWRDMEFDDITGDIWLRSSNKVIAATRTGGNSVTNARVVVDTTQADLTAFQNIAFVRTPEGAVAIFNDRWQNTIGQLVQDVVRAVRPDGTLDTIDWGTFAPLPGSGAYDFSYHAGSQTLAMSDFHNRRVTIFSVRVPPFWSYGPTCPGAGGIPPRLVATGGATPGSGAITYQVRDALGGSLAWMFFGFTESSFPLGVLVPPPFVSPCNGLISPVLPFSFGPLLLSGSAPGTGTASAVLNIPAGPWSGIELTTQGVVLELTTAMFISTNGIHLRIP